MKIKEGMPLRLGVGIVLLNDNNEVFVGKRIDNPENFLLGKVIKLVENLY